MPLTHSGRYVTTERGVPSLEDIALSLSRQPRFGGHVRRWWSVLDHTLFMYELLPEDTREDLCLAVLLHDAHEAITADIPSDVKSPEMKAAQEMIDLRLFNVFFARHGGAESYREMHDEVARYDRRALNTEGAVVGPPHWPKRERSGWDIGPDRDEELLESMLVPLHARGFPLLREVAPPDHAVKVWLGNPEDITKGTESPLVREYIRLVLTYL